MLDVFHLPTSVGVSDVQIFNNPVIAGAGSQWQTWLKPRGKSMCQIICIGGGGGGGGGFAAAAGSARGGGGGGGSSGIVRVQVPLIFLPDRLFIRVGEGGAGVSSGGGTAGSGSVSRVAIYPDIQASNSLAVSGGASASGGGTGTGAAVGAAGTAGGITLIGSMPLAGWGQFNMIAGQGGAAGGAVAGAIGPPATIPVTSSVTMGGGGGAGTTSADFAGSIVTPITDSLLSEWRPAGAVGTAGLNTGSSGPMLWEPFWSYCGLGGGASNTGNGGNGGNGAYGSGGGGGGGGTAGGGRGGVGGQGLVIILCW